MSCRRRVDDWRRLRGQLRQKKGESDTHDGGCDNDAQQSLAHSHARKMRRASFAAASIGGDGHTRSIDDPENIVRRWWSSTGR
jgi:hypothetical protein